MEWVEKWRGIGRFDPGGLEEEEILERELARRKMFNWKIKGKVQRMLWPQISLENKIF